MIKTNILKALRETNSYISGQSLCKDLGVSRTAVWKVINQLKDEGYEIEAVQNKGYRIITYPDIVTESEILSVVSPSGIIENVVFYEETDSTNNEAKRNADEALDRTLYITESQTGGRGRRGRQWISPAGSGIWMSLYLKEPSIAPESASMLTIVAAMAMVGAVKSEVGDVECKIKWPNDLVLEDKKICGILTEMSAELDFIHYVIIGIGLNVNTTEFDDSIKDMASSIYKKTGKTVKRSNIIAAFSESFKGYYDTFVKDGNLKGLQERYNQMLINKGRVVKAILGKEEVIGEAIGINSEGELIIKTIEGNEEIIRAGEVSVRGLYGYV